MQLLDRWREILEVLWRRKLRTLLTALSVSWGIFMLVILLGAGNGLSNGAHRAFEHDAMNSVWVNPGMLSKAYRGQPIGKAIKFTNDDHTLARDALPIIEMSSARFNLPAATMSRRGRQGSFPLRGVHPEHQLIEKTEMVRGRYINEQDIIDRRKVAVIGVKIRDTLFARGEEPIGERVQIGGSSFLVVGVSEELDDEQEDSRTYIPLTTAQAVFGGGGRITQFMFTVGNATSAQTTAAVGDLTDILARRHNFAADDKTALRVRNSQEIQERFNGLFNGISAFIWVIGLGTIVAGVVGVSNIMLISVKERTREIGIRKAIGAQPASIVGMILEEALILTMVSGYLGLVAGVATLQVVNATLPSTTFFRQPDVDLRVALAATAVLVAAGVLAGLFPALRASRINPIAAMRVE